MSFTEVCYLPKSGGRLVRDISFRPSTVRLRSCTNPGGNLQTSTYYTCIYPLVWRMWPNITVKWAALLLWFSKFSVQISTQRQTTLEVFLWDSYSIQASGQQAHVRPILLPAEYLQIRYSLIILLVNSGRARTAPLNMPTLDKNT